MKFFLNQSEVFPVGRRVFLASDVASTSEVYTLRAEIASLGALDGVDRRRTVPSVVAFDSGFKATLATGFVQKIVARNRAARIRAREAKPERQEASSANNANKRVGQHWTNLSEPHFQ